jgi:hypothetical protein
MLHAVRQHEGTVGRTLATRVVCVELEVRETGDEARFPDIQRRHVRAAIDRNMPPLALIFVRLPEAADELMGVVKDEIAVVMDVDRQRRIVGA